MAGAAQGAEEQAPGPPGSMPPADGAAPTPVEKGGGAGEPGSSISTQAATAVSEIEEDPVSKPAVGGSDASGREGGAEGEAWGAWPSGWGLGQVGRGLSQFAAEAARDVRGLKDSLQKAFAEDGAGEEAGGPEGGAGERRAAEGPGAGRGEEALGESALRRLTGEGDAFQQGIKAIDDQVEHLAAGVGKTLGSLWGGLGGAMKRVSEAATSAGKEIVETVEGGIRDVQELEAVKSARSSIKAATDKTVSVGGLLAAKSAKGLESIGRRTFSMLDEAFNEDRTVDGDEPITFDSCFYIYGGQQYLEELEALSNECARKYNKERVAMDEEAKAKLDATVTELGPIFDLEANDGEEGQEQLPSLGCNWSYAEVEALKTGSVEEAGSMATVAMDDLVKWAGTLDSPRSTTSTATPRDVGVDPEEGIARGTDALLNIQVEGTKRLAEICTCGEKGLLTLGKSLAVSQQAAEGPDKLKWPKSQQESAKMLRAYAQKVACDTEVVAGAFVEALLGVGSAYSERLRDGTVGQEAGSIASDMEVDGGAAVAKIHEGLSNLLNASICAALDAKSSPA